MTIQSFYKLHENKWAWSQRAIRKFNEGFHRFDPFHNEQEQIYIGVYGSTQVGKTAFILTLLGIDETKLPAISDALRGKDEYGNSATIICTIFKKTSGSQFIIHWPNGDSFHCQSLNEVSDVMTDLGNEIERSTTYSTSECVIEIPLDYFKESQRYIQVPELLIIDLPGVNTKETQEVHHVNRILSNYLRICKVCLLLEKATRLVSLTNIPLESVKHWNELPVQFRIVLTHSLHVQTALDMVKSGEMASADHLISFYHNELKENMEIDSFNTKVYPLEYEDTFLQISKSAPAIYNKIQGWFDRIYEQLVEDLLSEYTPEQEIYKLIHLDRYLIERRDLEITLLKAEIKEEEDKLEIQSNHLITVQQRLREDAFENYQSVKSVIKDLRKIETNMPFEPLRNWNQVTFTQAKVDVVKANFIDQYYSLQKQYNTKMEELKRLISFINDTLFLRIKSDVLVTQKEKIFFNELSYYKTQQYLIPKNFNRDIARLNTKLEHFRLYLEEKLKEHMTYVEDEISIALNLVKNDFKELQIQKRLVKAEIAEVEKIYLSLQADLHNAIIDRENDLDQSNHLLRLLTESFVEESNQLKELLLHPDTPATERWVIHQYWNELAYHAKEIISYVARNNSTV